MNIEIWDLVWIVFWAMGVGASVLKSDKTGGVKVSDVISSVLAAAISFLIVYKAGMFL